MDLEDEKGPRDSLAPEPVSPLFAWVKTELKTKPDRIARGLLLLEGARVLEQLGRVGEAAKAMVQAGELRVLTVLSDTSAYPGVPSIAQLGYPELAQPLKLHRFVIGPPEMPKEVTDPLLAAFKKVFADKEFLAFAKKVDFEPGPVYGEEAERIALGLFKYYDEKTPILKKYLQ